MLDESTGWEQVEDHIVAVSLSGGNVAVFSGLEAQLWRQICEGKSHQDILQAISGDYEVSETQLSADLDEFVLQLRHLGFLKE